MSPLADGHFCCVVAAYCFLVVTLAFGLTLLGLCPSTLPLNDYVELVHRNKQ